MYGECVSNAMIEVNENGGNFVMGSLGFQKLKGGLFWQFGDANKTTVEDFKRI